MYENNDTSTEYSSHLIYPYEACSLPSSLYENNIQQSRWASTQSNLSSITRETISLTPPFQNRLPILFVTMLGILELIGGLIVLILEILVFDIAIGLWCGFIYVLSGAAIIVLVFRTDRERHQTSAVLIIQFIAFMFTVTEISLHFYFYQMRCVTKLDEPSHEISYQCLILLIQVGGAAVVLVSTIIFAIVYCRITIVVLKQPHGTFNVANAMNLTC